MLDGVVDNWQENSISLPRETLLVVGKLELMDGADLERKVNRSGRQPEHDSPGKIATLFDTHGLSRRVFNKYVFYTEKKMEYRLNKVILLSTTSLTELESA